MARSSSTSPIAGEKRGPRTPTSAQKAAEQKRAASANPAARRSSRNAAAMINDEPMVAADAGDEAARNLAAAAQLLGFGETVRVCEPCNADDACEPPAAPSAAPPPAAQQPPLLHTWDRHRGFAGGPSEPQAAHAGSSVTDCIFGAGKLVRAGLNEHGFKKVWVELPELGEMARDEKYVAAVLNLAVAPRSRGGSSGSHAASYSAAPRRAVSSAAELVDTGLFAAGLDMLRRAAGVGGTALPAVPPRVPPRVPRRRSPAPPAADLPECELSVIWASATMIIYLHQSKREQHCHQWAIIYGQSCSMTCAP